MGSVGIDGSEWTVGTDGVCMLAIGVGLSLPALGPKIIGAVPGFVANPLGAPVLTTAEELFALGLPLPETPKTCERCAGSKIVECDECRGNGLTECGECEQDRDCPDCDGKGKHECGDCCDGDRPRRGWSTDLDAHGRVYGVNLHRQRLWTAMRGLSGSVEVRRTHDHGGGLHVRGEFPCGTPFVAVLMGMTGDGPDLTSGTRLESEAAGAGKAGAP